MNILETKRLVLSQLSEGDAEFILKLLNEPSFIHYIGDKGVRTLDDAREYLANGPIRSYADNGYGLYLTKLKRDGSRAGICGLVKRNELEDPDIGFAFLPAFWSQGYARESAAAVLEYAAAELGLGRVLAITSPDNHSSIRLLRRLGLEFERIVRLTEDGDETNLYAAEF